MTVQKTEQYTKRVEFKAVDSEQQIATGGVFLPSKVDLQGDFARPPVIRDWSADFMRRLQNPEESAEGGVMHVAFPSDHVSLVENTVLEADSEIGGKTFPADSWVQSWQFHDDELWSLVEDDILTGYSIGGREITWSDPIPQGDLPDDVAVAADYPDDEPVWEILGGTIAEVSSVDIPAVPDAQIVSLKADDLAKELPADREEFMAAMQERGHSEEEAERLYRYLQRATGESMAAAADGGWLARAKAFFSGDGSTDAKASRTLSDANLRRLMAAHDSIETSLSSEIDFRTNRFTDNPAVDFDVAGYDGKAAPSGDDGGDGTDADPDKDTMTDNDPDDPDKALEDAPEWAKALYEQTEENSKRIEELVDGDKDADGGDDPDDPEKALEDAPEWAKALHDRTEKNAESIEELAKASGTSQQLRGGEETETGRTYSKGWDDTFGLPTEGDA